MIMRVGLNYRKGYKKFSRLTANLANVTFPFKKAGSGLIVSMRVFGPIFARLRRRDKL